MLGRGSPALKERSSVPSKMIKLHVHCMHLQPGITYTLVGYSDGPDFFNISSTSGQIAVRNDLRTDNNKKTVHFVSGLIIHFSCLLFLYLFVCISLFLFLFVFVCICLFVFVCLYLFVCIYLLVFVYIKMLENNEILPFETIKNAFIKTLQSDFK